jgi:hypothetical protein
VIECTSLLISHASQSTDGETPALDAVGGGRTGTLAIFLGIPIAAIAFLLLIAILVFFLLRCPQSKEEPSGLDSPLGKEFNDKNFGTVDDDEKSLSFTLPVENCLKSETDSLLNEHFLTGVLNRSLVF